MGNEWYASHRSVTIIRLRVKGSANIFGRMETVGNPGLTAMSDSGHWMEVGPLSGNSFSAGLVVDWSWSGESSLQKILARKKEWRGAK